MTTNTTIYRGYRIYQDRDFDQNIIFYVVNVELEDDYGAEPFDTACASLDEVKALIDEMERDIREYYSYDSDRERFGSDY